MPSTIKIEPQGNAYFLIVEDEFSRNQLAVTWNELLCIHTVIEDWIEDWMVHVDTSDSILQSQLQSN